MVYQLVAAGVGAIASLVGGRKAAKEQRRMIAEQNAYNAPDQLRARAEKAGFNPLLFVGPGVGQQTSIGSPVMGEAIMNAGLSLAAGLADYGKEQGYAAKLEQQNAELRKALNTSTLRPEVAGVYGTAQPVTVRSQHMPLESSYVSGGTATPAPSERALGFGAFADVEPTSLYAPYVTRAGVVLDMQEGTDLEDVVSAIPMNAMGNLIKEGTIPPDFVDRLFLNAENLTTEVLRPVLKGAKYAGEGIAGYINRRNKPWPQDRGYTVAKRSSDSYPW